MTIPVFEALTQVVLPLSQRHYLKLSALVVLLVIVTIPLEVSALPVSRKFRLDNPHINYPMVPEHVPVGLLAVYAIVLPIVLIVQCGFLDARFRPSTAIAALGFLLAITGTMFITDALKLLIGNHRPDFVARCIPKEGLPTNALLSVTEACTNPLWGVVLEGCKSTPSGHSSLSFAGLLFVSLVLKRVLGSRIPSAFCFLPLILAFYVAGTRIVDHRHHWVDIISGSILGSLVSYVAYTFVLERPTREEPQESLV